jgi:hypothetical protein
MASFDVDADAVEGLATNPITDFSLSVYSLLMFREEPDAPNTAGATFSFDAFLVAYWLKEQSGEMPLLHFSLTYPSEARASPIRGISPAASLGCEACACVVCSWLGRWMELRWTGGGGAGATLGFDLATSANESFPSFGGRAVLTAATGGIGADAVVDASKISGPFFYNMSLIYMYDCVLM